MDKWLRRLFGIPDPPPLWRPAYQNLESLFVTGPGNSGNTVRYPLNQQHFVVRESADWLAKEYGASVTLESFAGAGGPIYSPVSQFMLQWSDGLVINAGLLAYYYCPAGQEPPQATVDNPSLARTQCVSLISTARTNSH